MGLEGRAYALTGRQYHGKVGGRQVDVFFARGPTFSIYVGTSVKTRFSASDAEDVSQALTGLFNREPLEVSQPELEGLTVFSHEDAWGEAFLAEAEVPPILQRLIQGENPFLIRQLLLNPSAFSLRLHRGSQLLGFRLEHEQVKGWLDDLVQLAVIAESLPAPQEALEESDMERDVRTGSAKITMIALAIVAAFIIIPICIVLVVLAGIFLFQGGTF